MTTANPLGLPAAPTAFGQITPIENPGQILSQQAVVNNNLIELVPLIIFLPRSRFRPSWGCDLRGHRGNRRLGDRSPDDGPSAGLPGRVLLPSAHAADHESEAGRDRRADDPGAVVIDIVPREGLGEDEAGKRERHGFFCVVDAGAGRRCLRATTGRWVIPHDCVISCVLDPKDARRQFSVLLLTVSTREGPRELTIVSRSRTRKRCHRATGMRGRRGCWRC